MPIFVEDDTLEGANVTIYTGLDFTGFRSTPRPGGRLRRFPAATTTTPTTPPGAGAGATSTSEASMVPTTPPGQLCG